jgi:hypothetical protein
MKNWLCISILVIVAETAFAQVADSVLNEPQHAVDMFTVLMHLI